MAIPSELSRLTIDIVSEASLGARFTAAEGRRFVELFFAYHRRVNPVLLLLGSQDDAGQQALVERMGLATIGAEMRELIRRRFVVPRHSSRRCLENAKTHPLPPCWRAHC